MGRQLPGAGTDLKRGNPQHGAVGGPFNKKNREPVGKKGSPTGEKRLGLSLPDSHETKFVWHQKTRSGVYERRSREKGCPSEKEGEERDLNPTRTPFRS